MSFKTTLMKKAIFTIVFLVLSNTFMTFAWYGHLKFKSIKGFENLPVVCSNNDKLGNCPVFEYCFQCPCQPHQGL